MSVLGHVLLVGWVLAAGPEPLPRTPIAWVLGSHAVPGSWVKYDATIKAGDFAQASRVTFLLLGPAEAGGVRGDWLEIQEELVSMGGAGLTPATGSGMVTRAFFGRDGKLHRAIVQRRGRPAVETVAGEHTSVAIGSLAPFEALDGKITHSQETLDVAALGATKATVVEVAGAAKTKIWRRASDGLCLRILSSMGGSGSTTYELAGAGVGGATKIVGPIQPAAPHPELEMGDGAPSR
jgi:hypothetical protein